MTTSQAQASADAGDVLSEVAAVAVAWVQAIDRRVIPGGVR